MSKALLPDLGHQGFGRRSRAAKVAFRSAKVALLSRSERRRWHLTPRAAQYPHVIASSRGRRLCELFERRLQDLHVVLQAVLNV